MTVALFVSCVFCVCYVCPFLVLFVVVCVFGSLCVLFAFLYVIDVCAFALRFSRDCVLVRCVLNICRFIILCLLFVFVVM